MMWGRGRVRHLNWSLGCVAVLACALVPGSAAAATLGNGVLTAAPDEGGVIQVIYDPGTDTYAFPGWTPTDTDGPGGCYVSGYTARCPASEISKIVINAGDRRDFISVGTNGFVPPIGLSEANQVRIPVEIHGNGGNDIISGGWGRDVIDGGPGSDLIDGREGSYLGTTPEFKIQAPDLIACGSGDDFGGNGFTFEDTAQLGPGDLVSADCEAVEQMVNCPRRGPDCVGVAPVDALIRQPGAQASAHRAVLRTVVVGVRKFRLKAGQSAPVTTRLSPARLRKVLRGTKSVPATYSAIARKSGVSRVLHRTRFRLTKAR